MFLNLWTPNKSRLKDVKLIRIQGIWDTNNTKTCEIKLKCSGIRISEDTIGYGLSLHPLAIYAIRPSTRLRQSQSSLRSLRNQMIFSNWQKHANRTGNSNVKLIKRLLPVPKSKLELPVSIFSVLIWCQHGQLLQLHLTFFGGSRRVTDLRSRTQAHTTRLESTRK